MNPDLRDRTILELSIKGTKLKPSGVREAELLWYNSDEDRSVFGLQESTRTIVHSKDSFTNSNPSCSLKILSGEISCDLRPGCRIPGAEINDVLLRFRIGNKYHGSFVPRELAPLESKLKFKFDFPDRLIPEIPPHEKLHMILCNLGRDEASYDFHGFIKFILFRPIN